MPEYAPLLSPGFVDVAIDDLEDTFVTPFADAEVRRDLVTRFRQLVVILQRLGITGTFWLDGSFVTEKPHPGDIDAVLLVEDSALRLLNPRDLDTFGQIIQNKHVTKLRYGCDLYYCDPANQDGRSYWRGWFAFNRDEEVKGIARVAI